MADDMVRVATHIPLLVRAFELSEGDVLEMGTGYFSTMVLRWLCEMSGRKLYSFESKEYWYRRVIAKPKPFHIVTLCKSWDDAKIERHWGLAFIDHNPNERRKTEVARLAHWAEYIVIHDTDPKSDGDKGNHHGYHYSEIWHLFKYRYDFTKYSPNSSVVSNFNSLEKF